MAFSAVNKEPARFWNLITIQMTLYEPAMGMDLQVMFAIVFKRTEN
jgi:hypothetical protein